MPKYCHICLETGHLSRDCQSTTANLSRGKKTYASTVVSTPQHIISNNIERNDDEAEMETLATLRPKINTIQQEKPEITFYPFFTKKDVFSNFYECSFEIDDRTYNTTEQYLLSQKAIYIGDLDTAEKIMRNREARTCKQLGERDVPWSGTVDAWRELAT